MIKINGKEVSANHFPDGTLLIKESPNSYISIFNFMDSTKKVTFTWLFENNEELVTLIFLTQHFRSHGFKEIYLKMPYIPNARQDRVKNAEDVFTLKYFAQVINWLGFETVTVLDPHSSVSEALIDRLVVQTPQNIVNQVIKILPQNDNVAPLMMFYPDEGAMKRYSNMFAIPYAFGIKKRDWSSGAIKGLDVSGMTDKIAGSRVLIVDDISSRGGTFYHSAKKLKELGATEIYLYISHCENTILNGEVLTSGLIDRVYTTNSIFTKEHEKIEVLSYDEY